MSRLVEVCPQALEGVRADVDTTRREVLEKVAPLRARMLRLGVATGGLDEAVGIAERLGSHVLPVVDTHLQRARALAEARYGGAMGAALPVVDFLDPVVPVDPFTVSALVDGASVLTWDTAPVVEHEVDARATEASRGIGDWLGGAWGTVTEAVGRRPGLGRRPCRRRLGRGHRGRCRDRRLVGVDDRRRRWVDRREPRRAP